MGVSKNRGGPPKSSMFNRVFHYKPSILRYQYFWKHPHVGNLETKKSVETPICSEMFIFVALKNIDLQKIS